MKYLLPMNLQFFSEEGPQNGQGAGSEAGTPTAEGAESKQQEEKQDDPPPKTYSEKEYNDMAVGLCAL